MSALDAVRGCFVAASLLLASSIHAGPVVVTDPNAAAVAAVEIFNVVPAETIAGEPYAVHVRVAGGNQATGLITVSNEDTSCQVTATVASSCSLNSYTSGITTITANYPGDGSNPPSTDSAPHRVGDGKIVIQAPNVTAIIGAQITVFPYYTSFPATPSPTGVFEVYVAGNLVCTTPIGGGFSQECTVPPIFVDNEYPIDVIYAGDANFIGATGQGTLTIIPQPCSANNVTLSTQAAINAFQASYGPCAYVTSRLTFTGADITDLSPLANLIRVDELFIESNAALSSLNGLGNIKRILNQVRIQNNPLLASVGLNALNRAGEVRIDNNAVLTSLAGLASLAVTTNQLRIQNNPMLTNIGMGALLVVGTDLWIENNLTLTSLAGLANVTRTGNQLRIQNNPMLTSVGLNALTMVGTDLTIDNNAALTSLAGLGSIVSAGNRVDIVNNPMLTSVGLNALTVVGTDLNVENNAKLTSLAGLHNIVSTGNVVNIQNNPLLTSVGLNALTVVGTDLNVANNAKLTSLAGLGNVASTGSQLYIQNNPLLASIGMGALTTVGTELVIQGNATLVSLVGLGNLVSTGNAVRILNNPQLASIDLTSLTTVGADLEIEGNAALTSLAGLASAVSSGSRLEISNNGLLTSLNGLQAFRSVQSDVEVIDNAQLSDCGALTRLLDAVDDALPGPGPGAAGVPDVGSLVTLSGNQANCNSIGLIERVYANGFE